jgi:hypothetical protein
MECDREDVTPDEIDPGQFRVENTGFQSHEHALDAKIRKNISFNSSYHPHLPPLERKVGTVINRYA